MQRLRRRKFPARPHLPTFGEPMAVLRLPHARRILGAVALLGLSACAALRRHQEKEQQEHAAAPARGGVPSEANVMAMLLAANNTDVSYGQVALAPGRTTTAPILGFAHRM